MNRQTTRLCTILVVALVARSVLCWAAWNHLTELKKDERNYFTLAHSLLAGHGLGQETPDGYVPTSTRTPVYPVFLAFFCSLGGLIVPLLVQVMLSAGLSMAIYLFAVQLERESVGLLAALILAIDPATVAGCLYHLTEVLYSVLLFTATAILIWAHKKGNIFIYLLAGLAMGIATLCRPNTLYVWVWLIPWFLFSMRNISIVSRFASYGIGFWLTAGLWYLRNYLVFGFFFFTSISSWNLYTYRAAWVEARGADRPYAQVAEEFRSQIERETHDLTNPIPSRVRLCTENSLRVFERYPVETAVMLFDGAFRVLLSPSRPLIADLTGLSQGGLGLLSLDGSAAARILKAVQQVTLIDFLLLLPDLFIFGLLYSGILYLAGWSIAHRHTSFPSGLMLWIALYLLISSAGPEAYARFRIPLTPFLAWCSAEGWMLIWHKITRRSQT